MLPRPNTSAPAGHDSRHTDDKQVNDAEKVEGIRTLLSTHETSLSDNGIDLAALQRDLASELSEDDYYGILGARSVWIQNRISPIIKAMTFQGEPGSRRVAHRNPVLQGQRRSR